MRRGFERRSPSRIGTTRWSALAPRRSEAARPTKSPSACCWRGCLTPRRQGLNAEFASTPSPRDRSRRRCCPASVRAWERSGVAVRAAEPSAEALGLDVSVIDGLAEADRFAPNYRSVEELRNDPEAWSRFLADPIAFLGGDAATFKLGVLQAIGPLLTNSKTKVAVFTHGLPINVVLSHALGLERITHFVPHY